MGTRDARNYRKGYQECLQDMALAYIEGGEERMIQWILDNADEPTREKVIS